MHPERYVSEQEGDKFLLALAKTVTDTPTDGTYNAVSPVCCPMPKLCIPLLCQPTSV